MKEIKIPFYIGQPVYYKTDDDQKKHLVTGIIIRSTGIIVEVSREGIKDEAYDFELTTEANQLLKLGIETN